MSYDHGGRHVGLIRRKWPPSRRKSAASLGRRRAPISRSSSAPWSCCETFEVKLSTSENGLARRSKLSEGKRKRSRLHRGPAAMLCASWLLSRAQVGTEAKKPISLYGRSACESRCAMVSFLRLAARIREPISSVVGNASQRAGPRLFRPRHAPGLPGAQILPAGTAY